MARRKVSSSNGNSGNGGIMGSGVFGMFSTGTTIKCDSTDDSMYCNIMKFFNLITVLFFVLFILYIVYTYVLRPYFLSNKRR